MLRRLRGLILVTSASLLTVLFYLHQSSIFHAYRTKILAAIRRKETTLADLLRDHATQSFIWQLDSLTQTQIDPIDRRRVIQFGPFQGVVPASVNSDDPFEIEFECTDQRLCPDSFAALIIGPSQHTFTSSPSTAKVKLHTLAIRDPGPYKVYLWPHYGSKCAELVDKPERWPERLASGSPFALQVTGGMPIAVVDRICENEAAILDGRWVNAADLTPKDVRLLGLDPTHGHIPNSGELLVPYFWLPYTCHVKHRSLKEHLARLKATHIVFVADSVMRDPFCQFIYIPNDPNWKSSACGGGDKQVYQWQTKQITIRYGDGPEESTLLTFVMVTDKFGENDDAPLKEDEARIPPSHIAWNQGLWFQHSHASREQQYARMTNTSQNLLKHYPKAKFIHRGTTSLFEHVRNCRERLEGRDACIESSEVARQVHEEETLRSPNASLQFMDIFKYSDARPDTTDDGRHFSAHSVFDNRPARPRIGEMDVWLMDLMFHFWEQAQS